MDVMQILYILAGAGFFYMVIWNKVEEHRALKMERIQRSGESDYGCL